MTLEAGKTYRFDLVGTWTGAGALADPYLRGIHDAEGTLIADTTNDNDAGLNSRVTFTPDANGTYYVAAGGAGDHEGTYRLSVTEVAADDDPSDPPDSATPVAVGGSATGEIDWVGDRDWFAVTLQAGTAYRFDLEGTWTDAGTLADPYLRGIHDADGTLIVDTTDDDGGVEYNSRVTFTPAEDGTYYVAAGSYNYSVGIYTLSVEEAL